MILKADKKKELTGMVEAFDKAKDDLLLALRELKESWDEQYGEKTEKWQEGEAGQKASDRISNLDGIIDALDTIEAPDLSELE